jgi:hypothetical protein
MNGLKPAVIHIDNIFPDIDHHRAIVIVDEDQQSLAIGKKGQNVRLASKLCGWDIDLQTRAEFEADGNAAQSPAIDAEPPAGPEVEAPSETPPEAPPETPPEAPPEAARETPLEEAREGSPVGSEQEQAPSEAPPADEPVSPPGAHVEP